MTHVTAKRSLLWPSLVGALAGLVTLAVAEVIAAVMFTPASSPLFAVGSLVIDFAPPWVKELVIALFGTGDKVALFVVLGVLVLVIAAAVGILQYRRPPWGIVALAAVGAVGVAAVATRNGATPAWVAPTVVGLVGGALVLRFVTLRLRDWEESVREERAGVTRRRFLVGSAATAALALVAGIVARSVNAATTTVDAVRQLVTLPPPATPAPAVPAGASLDIKGITPLFSANKDFYRIDTALQPPAVDAATWSLTIDGMVEREVTITFDELLALPLVEHSVTLMCVSNEVGGSLVGNAVWLGYPIHELLRRAGPLSGADMVLSTSVDGFTAGSPLPVLLDENRTSLLAVGMNGQPLPIEHGFPARLVVPGLYGYVSATKWVERMTVTTFAKDMGYWTPRGWSALGPVKVASRIDVPRSGDPAPQGTLTIAGVAWAQHRGIRGVEIRVDDGDWMPARLADAISPDTWVQWVYEWEAVSGSHLVAVRATATDGDTQRETRLPPAPNGSEGYHTITVRVQ
jgi:DMSO/TMAO reductase YedYZ molybdopterin-dependent catalytic subunit